MRITVEEAEELLEDPATIQQFDGTGRWTVDYMVIFHRDGQAWAFDYRAPATEHQDGQDRFDTEYYYDEKLKRWLDSGDVKCYRVEEKPHTQWVPMKFGG